jgi:hypothetical protein
MKQTTEPFEELLIPRKDLPVSSAIIYRVYSDHKNFELIEAASALDALAGSKIRNVYKVRRHDPLGDNVIQLNRIISDVSADSSSVKVEVSEVAASPQQEVIPSVEVAPLVVEAVESVVETSTPVSTEPAALSNDEIDKLLNG